MPLISESIPNLVNGVSQQPPSLRLKTQAELQENGLSTVVEGLRKRPSSEHIANLGSATGFQNAFIHTIRRDENEFYTMVITAGGLIRVFDKFGVEKTVTNATAYLSNLTNPQSQLTVTSIADYTFVANKTVTVQKAATLSPLRPKEALIFVKQGDYLTDYKVELTYDGVTTTASYTTLDASTSSNQSDVKTNNIAQRLYNTLNANLPTAKFTITNFGSVLYVKRIDDGDFNIKANDSRGDSFLKAFKGSVTDFYDLPPTGEVGFEIRVIGDSKANEDDYYVTLKDSEGDGNYTWKESVKGGLETHIDATTMPHQLVKQPDGSFLFQAAEWLERGAGDNDTNPFPSFVDKQINDVFIHRNRLGFLADENVIFSEAGEYYNFFATTVLTLLDSNPIDIAVSNNQVSILRAAVPFNRTLLLFSDLTQFTLSAGDLLTPETVAIDVATQFEASLRAKPVGIGRFVFFATRRGIWSGVREYFVEQASDTTTNALEITSHVPRYITGEVKKLAASSNEEMLLAITEDDPTAMYVYRYYWSATEKLQSSWSRWTFGGEVLNADFNMSDIYLLVKRGDDVFLERINLSKDTATQYTVNNFGVNLDRRVKLETGVNTTVPYTSTDTIYVTYDGLVITQDLLDWEGKLEAALNRGIVYAGIPYEFRYKLSEIVIKKENEPITISRLQLRSFALVYYDTGYFEVVVSPKGRTPSLLKFTGRVVGSQNNTISRLPIESGTFRFPVLAKSDLVEIEVRSSSFLPCAFQSAEWEGFYTLRSTRN
jgi:hypothetical protein